MAWIDVPVPEGVMVKIRAARKRRWRARMTGACAGLAGLVRGGGVRVNREVARAEAVPVVLRGAGRRS